MPSAYCVGKAEHEVSLLSDGVFGGDSTCECVCVSVLNVILGVFAELWKATVSFVMSVHPSAWNNSSPTGQILMKFYIWVFFFNFTEKHWQTPNRKWYVLCDWRIFLWHRNWRGVLATAFHVKNFEPDVFLFCDVTCAYVCMCVQACALLWKLFIIWLLLQRMLILFSLVHAEYFHI
jgi:hypothetical protein